MDPSTIYHDLKEKIVWLDLKPGRTLNLVELAETYKVSRTPVTIALTRLDTEEWIVRNGSHFVVSPLTVERIREITEMRTVLEVQAIIWAMHRLTPEGLSDLKEVRDRIPRLSAEADNRTLVQIDVDFHRIIYRETQNQYLASTLDRMLSHYLRFWLSSPNPIRSEKFFTETKEMIQGLEDKDELKLRTAAMAHIKASLDEIMGISHL